eukprot:gb/GFBE01005857.1/.p1 GENE.gb/GFBE01005857.1/~~gb/GFBE01005857.1/.p1  ORF type:complete len:430 (+),score=50.67 gb/GFBE01005857.1/:1-1290(+)
MAAPPPFAARPPRAPVDRPRSRGPQAAAAPPPFPGRPPKRAEEPRAAPSPPPAAPSPPPVAQSSMPLPPDLDLEAPWRAGRARAGGSMSPLPERRRALSAFPPTLEPLLEEPDSAQPSNPYCCVPIIRNVASFERPQAYAASLARIPLMPIRRASSQASSASTKSSARSSNCSRRRHVPSPIDQAIQREMIGDGIGLEEAVARKGNSGWAVKQRHAQRSDLGHFCYGCRQPLRDMNEEVTVWTGAAIYRRFHPACAASYVLKADTDSGSSASGSRGRGPADVVEGYADGWRAPRELSNIRPVEAARQWLLNEDQRAWGALRGDLFTTVTVTENGKKKAVPGLSHEQLRLLQTKHRWQPSDEEADGEDACECAVCFCPPEPKGPVCIRLPCAPQHVFHLACVLPWLRKASLCPTCRRDLRPLLQNRVASR